MELLPLFSPIPLPTGPGGTTSLTGADALGQEDFLQMLVTQLNNQDPLNPMDGQEFAAQLAQFASVEQLLNLNEMMVLQSEANSLLSQNMSSGIAAGLIGKSIEAIGNQIGWDGTEATGFGYDLEADATTVTVTIQDASGTTVRTLDLGGQDAGTHDLTWDGQDTNGAALPEGLYTFTVTATDDAGQPLGPVPLVQDLVDRVSFGLEGVLLWLRNVPVPMIAVQSVAE
jgi:flagellar basal-body rod modification protein FlgD